MVQESSANKINVGPLHQIALMVNDAQEVAENYWNTLGIGPWDIFTLEGSTVFDETYRGKPTYYGFKAGFCQCGDIQLELIQPTAGDSMYTDFIKEHGEGLQHVQYLVNTIDEAKRDIKLFAQQGFSLLMDGCFGDGHWAYIDTVSKLGCVWEVVKMPSSVSAPHIRIPDDEKAVSPAKIKVKGITQIGVVVRNLEEVLENYWKILGIGPWEVCEAAPPLLYDVTYHNKPSIVTEKVAYTMVGATQLQLVQPVSGENIYSDFLARHGQGLDHLQFTVEDVDQTTKILNQEGFAILMDGRFSDGGFAYYDTAEPLKCIWKALQVPKTMPAMSRYP